MNLEKFKLIKIYYLIYIQVYVTYIYEKIYKIKLF